MELTTRQNYTYSLNRHIMPTFAEFRMVDVLPADVREWIAKLQVGGVQPPTIRYAMTVLSAIFTTALNDQITFLHPCMGVKTPTVATKRRRIITPDQFGALYDAIPTRELQLLVETDVETGLRWGELIELRPKDIDLDTGVITVSRVAGELAAKFNPDGQRFFVKQYPKDTEWRAVTLSEHMFSQLADHAKCLKPDDLLFKAPDQTEPRRIHRPETLPDPDTLGLTEPNNKTGNTATAPPAATAPEAAAASTAKTPAPPTAPNDAPPAKTTPANPENSTPTATSPAPGSAA